MRLFVAIDPPPDVLDSLEDSIGSLSRENRRTRNISWVPRENLHLTLFFIGEVPQEVLSTVRTTLAHALRGFASFYVALERYVFFPEKSRPRIIGVAVSEQSGLLKNIHNGIARTFRGYSTTREHTRFVPHITIGRTKMNHSLSAHASPLHHVFRVNEVLLKESVLAPIGAEYHVIERFELLHD